MLVPILYTAVSFNFFSLPFHVFLPSSHLKSLPKFLFNILTTILLFTLAETNQVTNQQTRQTCHKNSNNNPQKGASLLKISNCFQCYDIRSKLLWLPSNIFFPANLGKSCLPSKRMRSIQFYQETSQNCSFQKSSYKF